MTLLQRLNAERGKLREAKRDIKDVKGELFIQQTEEMATIEQLDFEHTKEISRLTGERAELIASIRE